MAEPDTPDAETRERLLGVLAELVARGGHERLLAAPVEPGPRAFPEPWAPTRAGVQLLLRRLATHAGLDRAIVVADRRTGNAPPTERKPATRAELLQVTHAEAVYALGFIGADDVVGTLAHEIGVAHAVLHRPLEAAPYRSAVDAPVVELEPDDADLARGSIASVYVGLGVLAANAAYQQYSRDGRFNGGYVELEYDVLRAGHVPMSALAFLLAVQAAVRGERNAPRGLSPPQRDEVTAWLRALRKRAPELRERLRVPAGASATARPAVAPFDDAALEPDAEAADRKVAFRWRTSRGGVGLVAGAVLGVGMAAAIASRGAAPLVVFAGATAGHVAGRRVRVPRCSACASIVAPAAVRCPACGAALCGDIARLADRLDAEERLAGRDGAE